MRDLLLSFKLRIRILRMTTQTLNLQAQFMCIKCFKNNLLDICSIALFRKRSEDNNHISYSKFTSYSIVKSYLKIGFLIMSIFLKSFDQTKLLQK